MMRKLEFVWIREAHEVKGTGRNQTFKKWQIVRCQKKDWFFTTAPEYYISDIVTLLACKCCFKFRESVKRVEALSDWPDQKDLIVHGASIITMIKIAAGKPWKMTKSVSSVNTNRYTIELDLITHKVKTIESYLFFTARCSSIMDC